MQENIIFKSSAFGFDKKEVMAYIASLCEKNAAINGELDAANFEISKCKQDYLDVCDDKERLSAEIDSLKNEITECKKTIANLNAIIAELNEKSAKYDEIEGAEEKANKLMMDSLRYSESCIKNAQRVSESINISTKNKIDKAKNCLNTVSVDFKSLTGQLELSIAEISDRLAQLSKGLEDTITNG